MNNRHLCRGRRLDNGEWVQGDLIHWRNEENTMQIIQEQFGACVDGEGNLVLIGEPFVCKVDPTTVGHCTGLVAAKSYRGDTEADRLVFEGDIVRYNRQDKTCDGVVTWKPRNIAAWLIEFGDFRLLLTEEYQDEYEIIGTTHHEGSAE